jgi:hypothetical protein
MNSLSEDKMEECLKDFLGVFKHYNATTIENSVVSSANLDAMKSKLFSSLTQDHLAAIYLEAGNRGYFTESPDNAPFPYLKLTDTGREFMRANGII